jgi:hypothetical protein
MEYFPWVLGSVGGAVEVGNPYIYDCIGSTFEMAKNGNVTVFLTVVGCGYLIGSRYWGICCDGCYGIVNVLVRRNDGGGWSGGRIGSIVTAGGWNISVAMAPSRLRMSL